MSGTIDKLEKAENVLQDLMEDYSFSKKPNPGLIVDKNDSIEKEQMLKWNWEYEHVVKMIRIAQDYVSDARTALLEANI